MSITSLRISRPTRLESKRKKQEWNNCVLAQLQSAVVYLMQLLRGSRRGRRIPLLAARAPDESLEPTVQPAHRAVSDADDLQRKRLWAQFRMHLPAKAWRNLRVRARIDIKDKRVQVRTKKRERETHKKSLAQGNSSSFLSEIHTLMRRTQALYKAKDRRASDEDLLWQ